MHDKAVLVDIDGVLTTAWEALPGAVDALNAIRRKGVKVALLTNTTVISRSSIADRLRSEGFDVSDDMILTAPALAANHLRFTHPGKRCAVVTNGDISEDLPGIPLVDLADDPEVVLLGGAGPSLGYEVMNRLFSLMMDGVPLVALHRNLYWRTKAGLELDTGAYLAALEQATGENVMVIGKPSSNFFKAALEHLGVFAHEAMMVGDDVANDVLAAQDVGLQGILVRTGKYNDAHLKRVAPRNPDRIIPSFAALPALLGDHSG